MKEDKNFQEYRNRIAWALSGTRFKNKKQLADALDMRPNTITDAFRRPPTRETLERISKELNVDRYWLESGKSHDKAILVFYHFRDYLSQASSRMCAEALVDKLSELFSVKTLGLTAAQKHSVFDDVVWSCSGYLQKNELLDIDFTRFAKCFSEMIANYTGPIDNKRIITKTSVPLRLSGIPVIGSAAADNAAASRAELEPEAPGEEVQVIKEHYRLVKIVGNSMEPVILDGQYAMIGSEIRPGEEIKAKGWIGIIQVDCSGLEDSVCSGIGTFCKRVYPVGKNELLLTSINSSECAPFTVARRHVLHLWPVHGVFFMGRGMTPSEWNVAKS